MLGPFEPFYIVIHQVSLLPPLTHVACASMSTTTTTTTTKRDRGDRYGPMEWAQSSNHRSNHPVGLNYIQQVHALLAVWPFQ